MFERIKELCCRRKSINIEDIRRLDLQPGPHFYILFIRTGSMKEKTIHQLMDMCRLTGVRAVTIEVYGDPADIRIHKLEV